MKREQGPATVPGNSSVRVSVHSGGFNQRSRNSFNSFAAAAIAARCPSGVSLRLSPLSRGGGSSLTVKNRASITDSQPEVDFALTSFGSGGGEERSVANGNGKVSKQTVGRYRNPDSRSRTCVPCA